MAKPANCPPRPRRPAEAPGWPGHAFERRLAALEDRLTILEHRLTITLAAHAAPAATDGHLGAREGHLGRRYDRLAARDGFDTHDGGPERDAARPSAAGPGPDPVPEDRDAR